MEKHFLRVDGDDLLLAVRLKPKSTKDEIGGRWEDEKQSIWLEVQVRAVPEKGRANAALIQRIAKRLKLPARHVVLESGDTSRLKRLRLLGCAAQIADIIKELDGV